MTHTARIGVVLSSGGGRGVYAHTGFLLALQRLGIEFSAVSGCSAGALVGGITASGAVIELAPTEAICCKHGLDALIVHYSAVHREGGEGMARAMRQPWSLIEILYLLLYRHRPWYLSDQPLTFRRCPYGCGAPIIVLECDLPELAWPLNSGGPKVQAAAMSQALARLQPYAEMLIRDPRWLPLPPTSERRAATKVDRLDACHEPEHGKDHHEC